MADGSEIAQMLEGYVRVHRTLPNRVSVYCPFHPVNAPGTERHPSMSVYLDTGKVICFTCGYNEWLDQFLSRRGMDREGAKTFARALKQMRPARPKTTDEEVEERIGSLAAMVGVFQSNLPRNLLNAGFKVRTLDRFQVGYDLNERRVTYPVYDRHGGLVAIVGGAVDKDTIPKYKLYEDEVGIKPGTDQGHRNHLWGFNLLPPTGPYGIVEGYKAAMWVHQLGYPVVATQGVGFTPEQVELIVAVYRPVWILYDNDRAGRDASRRLYMRLLERMGPLVDLLNYEDDNPDIQPDDLNAQQLAAVVGQRKVRS
jgi:DNA primase